MKYGGIQGMYVFFFNKMLFRLEYTLPGLLYLSPETLIMFTGTASGCCLTVIRNASFRFQHTETKSENAA